MDELVKRLNDIPDAYFAFVAGIVNYVKKKPERLKCVMEYLDSVNEPSTSDVVHFVMTQPDFHEDGLAVKDMVGQYV